MKTRSPEVEGIAATNRHDLYLLTDYDFPFVQDGLRDGESTRECMTKRFEQVLTERGLECGWGSLATARRGSKQPYARWTNCLRRNGFGPIRRVVPLPNATSLR